MSIWHSRLLPDIRKWLASHRSKSVGEGNVNALEGFLRDPGHGGVMIACRGSKRAEQARRERTRRLILLGAWVLAQRKKLEARQDLTASEVAGFLDQGKTAERSKALLTDVLGK
ncbi:MAG: hypothetical protein OXH76_16400 [Boseongicola sp.]|nr:hypothetical protein [Boseongicola sp.]